MARMRSSKLASRLVTVRDVIREEGSEELIRVVHFAYDH